MWVQDEARYAEVLRELVDGRHWLVPYLNGFPYAHKPPFYFWVVAVFYFPFGNAELAFRLVSLIPALIAASGIMQIGKILSGKELGAGAAWIFLTAFCTLILAQIARMDMLLTAAAVFSWLQLLRFMENGQTRNLFGFWFFTLLCVAVKGPISLLFSAAPGLVWMYAERGWTGLRSMRPFLAILVLSALVLAWVAIVWKGGHESYLREIWEKQLVGRAVNSWSHKEPFYFYLALLPLMMLPWTGLVVRGGKFLYQEKVKYRFSIAAFSLVPLIGLSLISGKLFIYLEPLIPAFAIMAAYGVSQNVTPGRTPLGVSLPAAGFTAILAGLALWIWMTQPGLRGVALGIAVVGLFLILPFGLYLAFRPRPLQQWFVAWVVMSVPISVLVFGLLAYAVNPLFSARPLGEFVSEVASSKTPVGVANATPGILNNYAGRRFTELSNQEAGRWVADHPDGVLILKTDGVKEVFGLSGIPESCKVNRSFTIEFKEYHVVSGC